MKHKHEICPMQILLVSATANEIELFTKNGSPVDLLIAGVGVPATLYHLQKRQDLPPGCALVHFLFSHRLQRRRCVSCALP